ncbi:hypothetical protein JCM8097_003764 [Rhodosporidiobolus ruineniae]
MAATHPGWKSCYPASTVAGARASQLPVRVLPTKHSKPFPSIYHLKLAVHRAALDAGTELFEDSGSTLRCRNTSRTDELSFHRENGTPCDYHVSFKRSGGSAQLTHSCATHSCSSRTRQQHKGAAELWSAGKVAHFEEKITELEKKADKDKVKTEKVDDSEWAARRERSRGDGPGGSDAETTQGDERALKRASSPERRDTSKRVKHQTQRYPLEDRKTTEARTFVKSGHPKNPHLPQDELTSTSASAPSAQKSSKVGLTESSVSGHAFKPPTPNSGSKPPSRARTTRSSPSAPTFDTANIRHDLTVERPKYKLSSYGPGEGEPNLLDGFDVSPEELRLRYYKAKAANNLIDYPEEKLTQRAESAVKSILGNFDQAFCLALTQSTVPATHNPRSSPSSSLQQATTTLRTSREMAESPSRPPQSAGEAKPVASGSGVASEANGVEVLDLTAEDDDELGKTAGKVGDGEAKEELKEKPATKPSFSPPVKDEKPLRPADNPSAPALTSLQSLIAQLADETYTFAGFDTALTSLGVSMASTLRCAAQFQLAELAADLREALGVDKDKKRKYEVLEFERRLKGIVEKGKAKEE